MDNYSDADNEKTTEIEEFIQLLSVLLCNPKLSEDLEIDDSLLSNPSFNKLYSYIMDLRELSSALNKGDLEKFVFSKGFILSNLKALQSNLRHLTWQTQKIAEGDFTQKVDFLGDFSESFNEMTSRLKDTNVHLVNLANIDPLTQIPNRLALEQFLTASFNDAKAGPKELSILLVDIDHFKEVNDTYGHKTGDTVLVKVAEILSRQVRETDVFARYGGEEFMAVLPGADIQIAEKVGSRALKAVESTRVCEDPEVFVTVSMGISAMHDGDVSFEDIVKRSDMALYQSKNSGRNRLTVL